MQLSHGERITPSHGDVRLDSFIAYLIKNCSETSVTNPSAASVNKQEASKLYRLALLEQLTLPNLEANEGPEVLALKKLAERRLNEHRDKLPDDAEFVRHWHQVRTIFLYRVGVIIRCRILFQIFCTFHSYLFKIK